MAQYTKVNGTTQQTLLPKAQLIFKVPALTFSAWLQMQASPQAVT